MKLHMDPLGYVILAVILSMLGGYVNETVNEEPGAASSSPSQGG
jgi:hypothetical protein